ncbi:diguanylate cyclase [Massilia sp. Root418]|uniref:GGDEF domain-containing protein n=1 Tax=Massilia sp. Root418 TaxID=1736532 RepID=UPI000B27C205|nr:GGDEF domain-containing protein [Massilia sp. Root418]
MDIDEPTLVVVLGLASILASGVFFLLHASARHVGGVRLWASSSLTIGLAVVVDAAGLIKDPQWASVLFNAPVVSGQVLFFVGTAQFVGRPCNRFTLPIWVAVTIVLSCSLTFVSPNSAARVFTLGIIHASANGWAAWLFWRHIEPHARYAYIIAAVLTFAQAAAALLQALLAVIEADAASSPHDFWLFSLIIILNAVSNVLLGSWILFLLIMLRLVLELKNLAEIDVLTGILNRRGLRSHVDRLLKSARPVTSISVLLLDIDFFKSINDMHGHDIGDEVLIIMGKLLRKSATPSIIPCRWGGEEFCIVIESQDETAILQFAERIRAQFCEETKLHNALPSGATVSIGMSTSTFHDGFEFSKLISVADNHLYLAKGFGRNRVCSSS